MLKKLLLTTATLLALTTTSPAAVIGSFGVDPTSAAGAFSHAPGTGNFTDDWTFSLDAGGFIVVANATNTFARGGVAGPFGIQNFAASIFQTIGVPGGGDDILKFGPQNATLNPGNLSQSLNGIGFLPAGDYFLEISGNAGALAGYGGNLSVASVPEASTWAMMLLGFLGIGTLAIRRRGQFRLA